MERSIPYFSGTGLAALLSLGLVVAGCDGNTDFAAETAGVTNDKIKGSDDGDEDEDDGPAGPAETGATGTGSGTDTSGDLGAGEGDGNVNGLNTGIDDGEGTTEIEIGDDGITVTRKTFKAGGTVERLVPADYLIVIDNSVSMNPYLEKVRLGFLNIPVDKFGKGSKIAVMTGMASKRDDFTQVHPGVVKYTGIEKEPGFLSLVNAQAITNYKAAGSGVSQANKDKYPLPGCADSWFSPDGKAADNSSCLGAALQTAATGVGCEANVVAVEQMMAKNAGTKLFRDGAFVHVIFVSDEAHPGCNNADLLADCGTFAATDAAVRANAKISGLKFHGIVRPAPTTGAQAACAYQRHINASNGVYLDIGDNTIVDYRAMIQQVIESTTPEALVYQFDGKPSDIRRIVIDGTRYTGDYEISPDGLLIIRGLDMTKAHDVEITFVK